jgi:hypothetical protein
MVNQPKPTSSAERLFTSLLPHRGRDDRSASPADVMVATRAAGGKTVQQLMDDLSRRGGITCVATDSSDGVICAYPPRQQDPCSWNWPKLPMAVTPGRDIAMQIAAMNPSSVRDQTGRMCWRRVEIQFSRQRGKPAPIRIRLGADWRNSTGLSAGTNFIKDPGGGQHTCRERRRRTSLAVKRFQRFQRRKQ